MASTIIIKILSWNCQAVGKPQTFHNLKGINEPILQMLSTWWRSKINFFVWKKLNRRGFFYLVCVDPISIAWGSISGKKIKMFFSFSY